MQHASFWYADAVNLLSESINITNTNTNTEALLNASKEVGLKVNTKRSNCVSRQQTSSFPFPFVTLQPGDTFVSMNRFSSLCGRLAQ
jgi:hypothetical protein